MNKDIICVNNNQIYKRLYDDILKEPEILFLKELNLSFCCFEDYYSYKMKKLIARIIPNVQEIWPDILNSLDEIEGKCNNIIYYDENIDYITSISKDCDLFERHTQGAFIFCSNLESLNLARRAEILNEIEKDERITFNLITTGVACTKIMEFLKEDKKFENCIHNVFIYCFKSEKYIPLKQLYS